MARQNGMTIFMLYKLFTGMTPNILKSIGITIDHRSIERYTQQSMKAMFTGITVHIITMM